MSIYTKTFYPLMDIIDDMMFNTPESNTFQSKFNNHIIEFIHEIKDGIKAGTKVSLVTLHKVDDNDDSYDLVVSEDTTSGQIRNWLRTVGIL